MILRCLILSSFFCSMIQAAEDLSSEMAFDDSIQTQNVLFEPAIQPSIDTTLHFPEPNIQIKKDKSPFFASTLSSLCPGLGHVYLGDYKTSAALFGGTSSVLAMAPFVEDSNDSLIGVMMSAQSIWSYGVFAAYRDAHNYNGTAYSGYLVPQDHFNDLAMAPFRWKVMKKKEVWGGIIISLAAAAGISYLSQTDWSLPTLSSKVNALPLIALPVAISEESIFRGVLQTRISKEINPTAGLVLSSLAFGAAHIPNAWTLPEEQRLNYYRFSLPLITLAGTYMGYLTMKNHSLQESVALHMWYDFAIFASMLASKAAVGSPQGSYLLQFSF